MGMGGGAVLPAMARDPCPGWLAPPPHLLTLAPCGPIVRPGTMGSAVHVDPAGPGPMDEEGDWAHHDR